MTTEISQRDLRMRSREIMEAVERGESFRVTRNGRGIGELSPLRAAKTFVSRAEFESLWRGAPDMDGDEFRRDLDAVANPELDDPFGR